MADIDLALDGSQDIYLDGDDLAIFAGVELVAQRLLVGLRLFYGEWFIDPEAGVPYYRDILVNAPRTTLIESLLRSKITEDGDIESLADFTMTADRPSRSLSVSFQAVSIYGPVSARGLLP